MNKWTFACLAAICVMAFGLSALAQDVPGSDLNKDDPDAVKDYVVDPLPKGVIHPQDLEYRGAFRLPKDGKPYKASWHYSGDSLAYYPDGDPKGPKDGYPGSLFGSGHAHLCWVSEIAIPVPVISKTKDLRQLNTASTLQSFQDITVVKDKDGKPANTRYQTRGLEYLAPQGEQKTGKLYFCKATHFQYGGKESTHGWSELNLSKPKAAGLWCLGNFHSCSVNDYIFEIPKDWADKYSSGLRLATGRNRHGLSGSSGPTLYAYGPWNDGNPPPTDARLKAVRLVFYGRRAGKINNMLAADLWRGGAWLAAGDKSAVILVGCKSFGKCWYGLVTHKREPVVTWGKAGYTTDKGRKVDRSEIKGGRGYHADDYRPYVLFFNPADLATVAQGKKGPHTPQPYAGLDVKRLMFAQSERGRTALHGAAFDRERGLLYAMEGRGDGDMPLVHVWRINAPKE